MTGSDVKQRLAAILAADAAGYSRLMALDERSTVAALDAARAVFRKHLGSNEGRVIDMAGDSVLAVFKLATGAVSAALAIQAELNAGTRTVAEDRRMRFRIGVHIGEVIEKVDGTIYGDGVNIAARLQGLADPGGITISDAVRGSVKNRVAATFEDLGEQTVKNIADPVRVYRVKPLQAIADSTIPRMRPQVRFCTASDGVRLAYAISGDGPPLVRAPHWFTHLEHDWTNPAMRPWVEDLSRRYKLLRFDQRGTGMSDREVPEISPQAHARDLEAVVDAAGFERFALIGLSQGAAYAIAYTAQHPERVTHLVICGGFARGWAKRGWPLERMEQMETMVRLIEFGWGSDDPSFRQVFTTQFMPDASLEAIRGFNDLMPLTASAKTAATIFKTNSTLDVQAEARLIRCPTLVLHGRGEIRIPFEEGRLIAGLIPGARFVTLETRNHLMMQSEPAWRDFLEAVAGFYPPRQQARADGAFPELTAREREVLELIAQGLDNAQIAARLELSEKTVRNNITHIFDKIQVENRSQAIVMAREAGLGASRRER